MGATIRINPNFVANIRVVHEIENTFYKYIPAKKRKRLSFNFKKFFHITEVEIPDKVCDTIFKEESDVSYDSIIRDNTIYYKAKVLIYVSGQEDPYIKRFDTDEEADKFYEEISSLVKKKVGKKQNKNSSTFDNYIEL